MTLHCLYNAPARLDSATFAPSLAVGDAVLLLGSAVTAVTGNEDALALLPENISCYALTEDLQAHGIHNLSDRVTSVDYAGWVELVVAHATQCVWD